MHAPDSRVGELAKGVVDQPASETPAAPVGRDADGHHLGLVTRGPARDEADRPADRIPGDTQYPRGERPLALDRSPAPQTGERLLEQPGQIVQIGAIRVFDIQGRRLPPPCGAPARAHPPDRKWPEKLAKFPG